MVQKFYKKLAVLSLFFLISASIIAAVTYSHGQSGEETTNASAAAAALFCLSVLLLNVSVIGRTGRQGRGIAVQPSRPPPPPPSPGPGPGPAPGPAPGPGQALVITISADSWCGYSKKMSAEKDKIGQALQNRGVGFVLVSDAADKQSFDNLAKQHEVQGFPHSLVIVDGKKVHSIPGYMPGQAFVKQCLEAIEQN